MKVYCPCEKRCSGYSGSPRRCNCIEKSEEIPQEFIRAKIESEGAMFGSWESVKIGAGVGLQAAMVIGEGGGQVTYEVWQCPVCKCLVLCLRVKKGANVKENILSSASTCED